MTLKEFLDTRGDEMFCVNCGNAFCFIGTKAEYEKTKEQINDKIRTRFYAKKNKTPFIPLWDKEVKEWYISPRYGNTVVILSKRGGKIVNGFWFKHEFDREYGL